MNPPIANNCMVSAVADGETVKKLKLPVAGNKRRTWRLARYAALCAALVGGVKSHAAGTDTWVGNTDANWSTAANWSTVGGSTPPANGDSLVFGAQGSSGLTLNNDISGLSVNNLNLNGPGAFIFNGNVLSLYGTLTDAASVNETFGSGINLGAGGFAAIKNTGTGTLYLGALTRTAGSGGAVNFTATGTINTTTTTNASNNILGGWATVGNAGTTGSSGDWATIDGSGNIITYSGYTLISGATSGSGASAQNWKTTTSSDAIAGSGTLTVNSLVETTDFSVPSGATMSLGSGGLILSGASRWLKDNGNGNTSGTAQITSGLASGELFVDSSGSGGGGDNDWRIWPKIVDNGATPVILVKNGPGYVRLENVNTYSGGTILNSGIVFLSNNNVAGGSGQLGINTVTLNGGTLNLDKATLANNFVVPAGASAIIDNTAGDATLNGNFAGAGTVTLQNSSGNGLSEHLGGAWTNFTGTLFYNCSAGSSKNFNMFLPQNFDLSSATLNITNNGWNAGSTFRGWTSCKLGALNGPSGYLDAGCTYIIGYLNASTTYGGIVQGSGASPSAITKVGAGSLTLSQTASSYSGATTIENGALVAGANVSVSANGPFGNASSAIALGDALTESTNVAMNPQLLIGGAYTMARGVAVGVDSSALGNASTIFTLGGNTANNATFSGAITLNQNLVVTQATGGTVTISGSINPSGSQTVTKVGGGTAILSGANSYYGSTIVSDGGLLIGNTSQGNGPVTVADGAAAGVAATSDATYWSPSSLTVGTSTGGTLQFNLGGSITGPNVNTLLTPASLTLNGTTTIAIGSCPQAIGSYPLFNGYTSGTLVLGSQPSGLLGTLTVSGSTVYYQLTNFVQDVWTAAVNTNWDTVTANWTNSIGGNKYVSGYPVVFDDTAAGTSPLLVNITNAVTPNSVTVNNTNKAYVIGGLAIGGSTGLTKTGNNTLTLTGTNTFTGNMIVSGGTVEVGGAGQLGGGTYAANIQDDATLKVNTTAAQTLSGTIAGSGALVKDNTGTLTLPVPNASFYGVVTNNNGTIQLGDGAGLGYGTLELNGGTVANTGSSDITVGNNIDVGSGGGTITLGVAKNFTLTGALSGSGNLTISPAGGPLASMYLQFSANTASGTITIPNSSGNNQTVTRFKTTSAGSATAAWSIGGAQDRHTTIDFASGTIDFGSLSGTGILSGNGAGLKTVSVGALGADSTFSGVLQDGSGTLALTKVGAGNFTLTGANTFTGGVNLNGGVLSVGNASAIGSSGAISFGGGTLQYTPVNQTDYSPRIANSTGPISIDLNGTNVTFATALGTNNTGGLALTNSTGTGTLTLTANNLYTGTTLINAGTLALSGSGNIGASTNITLASGATYDVSGVTSYTLGGSQALAGSGTVTGAVTTAGSGSSIVPGGAGAVGTLTFDNNLNLSGGAAPVFDLSTSYLSGNDQVVVAGNLTLSSADTIHINALGGSANLDQTGDYVLFSVAGTTTMTTQPLLVFDNTAPANFNHYTVTTSGNNVVLHYSLTTAPVIASVVVTNTADGSMVGTRGQSATVYVTVQPGTGSVTNVTANLSQLGGSASQTLNHVSGNDYAYTFVLGPGATVGYDTVNVSVTDTTPLTGLGSANFTIYASTETWNGQGTDNNWSSGSNWVSTLPPGYAGDTVVFTGSARTSPNLEANYNVASLTFDDSGGTAGNFALGSATGKSLTLSGALNNYSSSAQVLNAPVVMNGTQTIYDDGNGITLAGNVSGSGLTIGSGTVTLAGANTYTGNTTISGGTLKIGSSGAIPSGPGMGNVTVSSTLDLNGTNASVNGLNGYGTVDNTGANAATLAVGYGDAASAPGGSIQNSAGLLTLVKVGTNVLTLGSANSFGGGVIISNGTVTLGDANAAGTGTLTLSGGTLNNSAGIALANNLVVSGGGSAIQCGSANNLTLNGGLSGSGSLKLGDDSHNSSLYLGMTNTMTSGTITFANNVNSVRFATTAAGNENMAFVFNNTGANRDTFDFGTGTIAFGSFTGSGTLRGNSAGVHTIAAGALGLNDVFSGTLVDQSGQIALTKVGTGTLTLTGANSYTGDTTISNGTLVVSTLSSGGGNYTAVDGATLGVSVVAGGSLKVSSLALGNSTNTFIGISSTVNPVITNTGALTLAGTVVVNVSGIVSVGQYPLIASASIGGAGGFVIGTLPWGSAATILTNGGNTIVLNVTTGSAPTFEWTGLNSANWDFATANNWLSNGVAAVYSDGQAAQFDDTSAQTNIVLVTNVAPLSLIVTNSVRSYTFSGAAIAAGSLTKSGNGTLTLANTNAYSGGTIINGGTLQLGDGVANNGVVAGNITDNGNLAFANPANQTFAGVISGTGSVNKYAAGALTLGVNNPYSGGTALKAGSVVLPNGATNSFGSGSLTLSNVTLVVQPGGGSAYNSANSVFIGNNLVVPAGTVSTIDNSAQNYGNLWVGGDNVQWTGSGTLLFQNRDNVIAPAVLWNGNILTNFHGTINIGATNSGEYMYNGFGYNSSNGGTGTSVATIDASGVAWQLGDVGYSFSQCVDANCTTIKLGSISATNTSTSLRGNSSSSNPLTFEVGALNTSTVYAGTINDWGSAGTRLTKVGTGTLTLSGANTYTGNTTVNGGTLELAQATLATNSTVLITNGAVLQLDFSTTNQVAELVLNGVSQPNGVYGSANSGGHIIGSGYLQVTAGVVTGPTLTSVLPNPVTGSTYPVTLSLTGSGFVSGATVNLTNLTTATGYSGLPATFNSGTGLSVTATLGTAASAWNATVVNPDTTASGQVGFTVGAPASVQIGGASVSSAGAGKVVLSGTGGTAGYSYVVLSATNLNPPVAWTPVVTNVFDGSGNFAYTNTVNAGTAKLFLRIQQ